MGDTDIAEDTPAEIFAEAMARRLLASGAAARMEWRASSAPPTGVAYTPGHTYEADLGEGSITATVGSWLASHPSSFNAPVPHFTLQIFDRDGNLIGQSRGWREDADVTKFVRAVEAAYEARAVVARDRFEKSVGGAGLE